MAAFAGATGGTTTTALANATIDRYIPARTLEVAKYTSVLYNLARKQPIPKGESNTVTFIKTNHLALPTSPLGEADSGNATALSTSRVSCVTEAWGAWVAISSLGQYVARDSPAVRAAERLGVNAARTIDREIVRQLLSGTNVYYGGIATTRLGLTINDIITTALMRKVRARMKRTGAPFYENNKHALVCGPEVVADIMADPTAIDAQVYSKYEQLAAGEMGLWMGFRIHESNTIPSITNGGAHNATITTPAAAGVETALNASGGNTDVDILITTNDVDGFENVFYTLAGDTTMANGDIISVVLPALPGTATSFNVYMTAQHATTPVLSTMNLQIERVLGGVTLHITGNGLIDGAGTGVLGTTTGRIGGVTPFTGVTVHPVFFFGTEYFVVTEIGKIMTPRSSGAQKSDPLDRFETIGWKMEGFRTVITDHSFGGRMEVASLN
jgi:N4-gp56 family major capsid protein